MVPLEVNPAAVANRQISILVLNKESESAIIHENQRSQPTKEFSEKSSEVNHPLQPALAPTTVVLPINNSEMLLPRSADK
ncbi:MAG TPA: hypothetical protein ACHBX0_01235 [Arsenophonus sp.]